MSQEYTVHNAESIVDYKEVVKADTKECHFYVAEPSAEKLKAINSVRKHADSDKYTIKIYLNPTDDVPSFLRPHVVQDTNKKWFYANLFNQGHFNKYQESLLKMAALQKENEALVDSNTRLMKIVTELTEANLALAQ